MKVTMVLAETAKVRQSFLDLKSAGWFRHHPDFRVGEVGLIIEVPWVAADQRHIVRVWLVRRAPQGETLVDSEPVWSLERPFVPPSDSGFPGGPVVGVLTCPMPPAQLVPNSLYTVRVSIDGQADEGWAQDFYTVGDDAG